MPRLRPRTALATGVLGLCAALTGCVPQGLAFRVDDRLTITRPEDRSTVRLPVTLEWTVRDFAVSSPGTTTGEDAGYFAVFVDRAPVPPGEPLSWVARKDRSCRGSEGCPDQEYLNARGVYPVTTTRLVLQQLPRTSDREDRKERHRAVVVLLDGAGKRIGESAFEIAFDVDRSTSS